MDFFNSLSPLFLNIRLTIWLLIFVSEYNVILVSGHIFNPIPFTLYILNFGFNIFENPEIEKEINNAFQTSKLMNNFMGVGRNHLNNEQENFDDNLINQNTSEEDSIINRKFEIKKNRKNKKKSKFSNINSKNNNNDYDNEYNNNTIEDNEYENNENDNEDNTNENNQMIKQNDVHIEKILLSIINKLNQMDENLHLYQKRNMYDIILYIIVGMLLSFVIYSAMRK